MLDLWFLVRGNFVPQGTIWQPLETFLAGTTQGKGDDTGLYQVEAKETSQHAIAQRITNKELYSPKCPYCYCCYVFLLKERIVKRCFQLEVDLHKNGFN